MTHAEAAQKLVVVLGMHRSGTSTITRGLQVVGVELGDRLMPPRSDNSKGFWEDLDIVLFNDELLAACGHSWHSIDSIQQVDVEFLCDRGYLIKAIDLLRSKAAGHDRFGFKDPRTAKMMPFWAKVFECGGFEVRYVLALRNPLSIVKLLANRDNFDCEKSYLLWINHIVESLSHLDGHECIVVDYDYLMHNPEIELRRLANWIGTDIDLKKLELYRTEFLDKGLRHSQYISGDVYFDVTAPCLAREIYSFLSGVLSGDLELSEAATSGRLKRWINECDRLRPIIRSIDKQERLLADLRNEIAERDRRIDHLNQSIEEHYRQLTWTHNEIAVLRSSTSWRLTAPVRWFKRRIEGFG